MTRNYPLYLSLFVSGIALTACATSPNVQTPEQVAAQSFPILDSYTGLEQMRLPSIRQGGWSGSQVTASLQTAESYQGQIGGAWLDVIINYETPTPDPAEMQVFNRGVWAGGEPVQLADFSATVLSCTERVESYGTGYYGGGYYGGGYYGGGHRGRYGRRGHHGDGDGRGRRGGHGGHGDDDGDTGSDDPVADDDGDTPVRPGRPIRPQPRVAPDERDEPGVETDVQVYRRGPSGLDGSYREPGRPRSLPTPRVTKKPVSDPTPRPRRPRPSGTRAVTEKPVVSRPAPRPVSRPAAQPVSRPAPAVTRPVASPKPVSRPKPAPKPVSRPAPKPKSEPVSRERPSRDLKGMHFNDENAAQKSDVTVSHRPYTRASYGGRAYRGYNRGIWPRSYWGGEYWGPYRDGILITQSCNRREQLRIYVPQDQLQFAQGYRGLTLLLRGEGGLERQVSLSQSYLLGYNLVARDFEQPYRPASDLAELADPFGGE